MVKKFDIRHEQEYYKSPPTKLVITSDNIVQTQMKFCTGLDSWKTLLTNKNVLEVGAGECSYLKYILSKATPNLFIMQDIFSERMIIAKNLGQYKRVDFVESDVLTLPFKTNSFDLCMAFGLLHHIPSIEEALAEISRVLKVGGKFIFRDPSADNPLIWLKYKLGHKSENEFPLSEKKLRRSLLKIGFKILHLKKFWLRFPNLPSGPWSVNIGGMVTKI